MKGKVYLGTAAAVNSSMGPIVYIKLRIFSSALLNWNQGGKEKKNPNKGACAAFWHLNPGLE